MTHYADRHEDLKVAMISALKTWKAGIWNVVFQLCEICFDNSHETGCEAIAKHHLVRLSTGAVQSDTWVKQATILPEGIADRIPSAGTLHILHQRELILESLRSAGPNMYSTTATVTLSRHGKADGKIRERIVIVYCIYHGLITHTCTGRQRIITCGCVILSCRSLNTVSLGCYSDHTTMRIMTIYITAL